MTDQAERDRATIEALKIALQQAAERLEALGDLAESARMWALLERNRGPDTWPADKDTRTDLLESVDALQLTPIESEITRYRAMAAEDWQALPVELNGPSGDA